MKIRLCLALTAVALISCQTGSVNANKALFAHIPHDPEVLVMIRPNELAQFTEKTISQLGLLDAFAPEWDMDLTKVEEYRTIAVSLFEAIGIPWDNISSLGFMIYLEQPIFLAAGDFKKDEIESKVRDVGFSQNSDGTFNYIYNDQKLSVPTDGLLMMASQETLQFIESIDPKDRLWNQSDFEAYRTTTPLDNTIFAWSKPPKNLFSGTNFQDELGYVSLGLDFKAGITFKSIIRLNNPERTVMLHDLVLGAVYIGRGAFSSDPEYGKLLRSIQVSHDSRQVETTMVITGADALRLRNRLVQDFKNPDAGTLKGFTELFDQFK